MAHHLPKSASILNPCEVRCSRFFLPQNIHMIGIPGRPVVYTYNFPTEMLSSYIDDPLKPIAVTPHSYLKESSHLLHVFGNVSINWASKGYVFTLDVKYLYMVNPYDYYSEIFPLLTQLGSLSIR